MTLTPFTINDIIQKNEKLNKQNVPMHERISYFKKPSSATTNWSESDVEIYKKNIDMVKSWYFEEYRIKEEHEFRIPLLLDKKLYLIDFLDTRFGVKTFPITTNLDSDKSVILYNNETYFNLYSSIKNSGLDITQLNIVKNPNLPNLLRNLESFNNGIVWYLNKLKTVNRSKNNLFLISYYDYCSSINNLYMYNYNSSLWSSQQASEKLIKGILKMKKHNYPSRGADGHNLEYLLGLLFQHNILSINNILQKYDLSKLTPNLRYTIQSSQEEAYQYSLLYLDLLALLSKTNL